MTIEEMRDTLTQIQNESAQTKMLNAILTCYAEIKNQQQAIIDLQNKTNEIINVLNSAGNAEPVNNDIEEDVEQADLVPEQPTAEELKNE